MSAKQRIVNKFSNQENLNAITKWAKHTFENVNSISIDAFASKVGEVFEKVSTIKLDYSTKRKTLIELDGMSEDRDLVYIFTRNSYIMKIGSSRVGIKERFGSYLCGHYVPERTKKSGEPCPGKMSVTNAYCYHSILMDIMKNPGQSNWEVYIWKFESLKETRPILGEMIELKGQVCHIYETKLMEAYKKIVGKIPVLCVASDPTYR